MTLTLKRDKDMKVQFNQHLCQENQNLHEGDLCARKYPVNTSPEGCLESWSTPSFLSSLHHRKHRTLSSAISTGRLENKELPLAHSPLTGRQAS